MKTYIALLRGINVSGQKIIKMADLKALFEINGFTEVLTYIQSGNIIFQSDLDKTKDLEVHIHNMIQKKYGFDVQCMVLIAQELKHVLEHNPYLKEEEKIKERISFTFLSHNPSKESIEALRQIDYEPEEFTLDGKYMYGYAANGFGRAKLTNSLIERKLKLRATSRNWKTISKLLELSSTK